MKSRIFGATILVSAFLLLTTTVPTYAATTITEFPLPAGTEPLHVATGFGFLWATGEASNSIIRLDVVTGSFVDFPIPFPDCTANGIATGLGAVWFACQVGKLGELNLTTGVIALFDVPGAPFSDHSGLAHVAVKFGSVWATGFIDGNYIAKFDVRTNTFTFFTVPTSNSRPEGIATGLGSVWFTENAGNNIGRLDPITGQITEFPVPTPSSSPLGITVAFGSVWFTEAAGAKVGRLNATTGIITEFTIPNPSAGFGSFAPHITQGDSFIWYTRPATGVIGQLDPNTGSIVEFTVPSSGTGSQSLHGITFGLGAVWFAEGISSMVGRITAS